MEYQSTLRIDSIFPLRLRTSSICDFENPTVSNARGTVNVQPKYKCFCCEQAGLNERLDQRALQDINYLHSIDTLLYVDSNSLFSSLHRTSSQSLL